MLIVDPNALKIYVDGSAYNNPGHESGYAGVAEFPDAMARAPETIFQKGFLASDNGRMELLACIEALRHARILAKQHGVGRVIIFSDSLYVVENSKRAAHWRKNGWRNSNGRPMENKDLWKLFLSERQKVSVRTDIEYQKGKGTPILKEVDHQAKLAAKKAIKRKDFGYTAGKISRSPLPTPRSASLYEATGESVQIRILSKRKAAKQESRICFTIVGADPSDAIRHLAYAPYDIAEHLHRSHSYLVSFNSDHKYPKIVKVLREISVV